MSYFEESFTLQSSVSSYDMKHQQVFEDKYYIEKRISVGLKPYFHVAITNMFNMNEKRRNSIDFNYRF